MKTLVFVLAGLAISLSALSQGTKPGQKVVDFTLKDAASGKDFSLSSFSADKTVVLVFTNSACPYAKLYENRLIGLAKAFSLRGVKFVFINPSVGASGADNLEAMAAKSKEWGGQFPYLADEGQKVSKALGATKTPEVFLLQSNDGGFVLKYKGAIDDNPQVEKYAKDHFLKNALEAVLTNPAALLAEERATGCQIK